MFSSPKPSGFLLSILISSRTFALFRNAPSSSRVSYTPTAAITAACGACQIAKRFREELRGSCEKQPLATERRQCSHPRDRRNRDTASQPHCRSTCQLAVVLVNRQLLALSARCRSRVLSVRQRL